MKKIITLLCICCVGISFAQLGKNHFEKSLELAEKNDFKGALKSINKALISESDNSEYLLLKAQLQFRLNEPSEAEKTLNQAVQVDPKNIICYLNRGQFYFARENYTAAIADFQSAVSFADNDSLKRNAYFELGTAKYRMADYEGAFPELKKAYDIDSTDMAVLMNIGIVTMRLGRHQEALGYLLAANRRSPGWHLGIMNIGFLYQEMEDYERALTYFNMALTIEQNDPYTYSNRGYTYFKMGKLKEAKADVERSLSIYPKNSYVYRTLALIYLAENKQKAACEAIQKALDLGYTNSYGNDVVEMKEKHCN